MDKFNCWINRRRISKAEVDRDLRGRMRHLYDKAHRIEISVEKSYFQNESGLVVHPAHMEFTFAPFKCWVNRRRISQVEVNRDFSR
jgi:hypothetical protein